MVFFFHSHNIPSSYLPCPLRDVVYLRWHLFGQKIQQPERTTQFTNINAPKKLRMQGTFYHYTHAKILISVVHRQN
jgi:hypothetical protein